MYKLQGQASACQSERSSDFLLRVKMTSAKIRFIRPLRGTDQMKSNPQSPSPARLIAIASVLLALTLLVYLPVRSFDFVNYDDPDYVTDNPHVRSGLTADGVDWALTSQHAGNWHPLTCLSHMLDCRLVRLKSGGPRSTNPSRAP